MTISGTSSEITDAYMDPWIYWHRFIDTRHRKKPASDGAVDSGGVPTQSAHQFENLPMIIKLNRGWTSATVEKLTTLGLELNGTTRAGANRKTVFTGVFNGPVGNLSKIRSCKLVVTLKASRPICGNLHDALPAIGASPPVLADEIGLNGSGVVIGFVDNGCDFLHANFRRGQLTRVQNLWVQSKSVGEGAAAYWHWGGALPYGKELKIEKLIEETAGKPASEIYVAAGYKLKELALGRHVEHFTHGTHIMDLAAGSDCCRPGVAPDADIMFVQLPKFAISENTGEASAKFLLDGVQHIFECAKERPCVVNLSYGAFAGPHDGQTLLEQGLDELLQEPNRAIVISAGNGHESGCHSSGMINRSTPKILRWIISADDPTPNFMNIWLSKKPAIAVEDGAAEIRATIKLIPPDGSSLDGVKAKHWMTIRDSNGPIGLIVHRDNDPLNNKTEILIGLNPTSRHQDDRAQDLANRESHGKAPAGIWKVELSTDSEVPIQFEAWIERDDRGMRPRGDQSRFHDDDVCVTNTVSSVCTGGKTIIVGGYNAATDRISEYSAMREGDSGHRPLPDIYAPSETDALGRGVLAAAAGGGSPVRLYGTSMAAPLVAGVVALMLQVAAQKKISISCDEIRGILIRTGRPLSACGNEAHRDAKRARGVDARAAIRETLKVLSEKTVV